MNPILRQLFLAACFYGCSLTLNAATLTVTSNADAGAGTFRNVVAAANNGDIIEFNLAAAFRTISLTTPLTITKNNLTINATTAGAGYTCGNPTIIIDLAGAPWNNQTLTIQGTGNIFRGLSFRNLHLIFNTGGNHQMYGCWFNLNATGTAVLGDNVAANLFSFTNCTGCTIGGTTCDTRNVFAFGAADTWQGAIKLNAGSNNNTFRGNYFGTDKNGMNLLNGSADHIIYNNGCTGITIDQNVLVGANIIGFIGGCGIYADGTSTNGFTITNNKIGVRVDGTDGGTTFGNAYGGVAIRSTTSNDFVFDGNVCCRNGLAPSADNQKCGLYVTAACNTVSIQDNFVGVTPTFQIAGNHFTGVFIAGTCSDVTIDNNVIGANGFMTGDESHGLSIEQACTDVTITNNYIGTNAAGANLGNYCSGITVSGGSNYTVRNNNIGFNKGQRAGIPNACIVFTNTTDVVIQNNVLGGMLAGGPAGQNTLPANSIEGGHGIFISGASAARYRIGGILPNERNIISYNRNYAIHVRNADFVEMRFNSMYCNSGGIELNYGAGFAANNNFGNGTTSITGPEILPTPPTSMSGTKPAGSIVDVFGTATCAGGGSGCIVQSEYRYSSGTYSYPTGTTWTYNHGATMFDDLSALMTGTGGDCSSGFCRTSEFPDCIDNQLPVTFVQLKAYRNNSQVNIYWTTSEEINAKVFVIERSLDGKYFEDLGTVKAFGNSRQLQSYDFTDVNPLDGESYYRIRAVDLDGDFSYSPTTSVQAVNATEMTVSPNPNNGNFLLEVSNVSGEVFIQVYNMLGESVYTATETPAGAFLSVPVALDGLTKGVYVISVTTASGILKTKAIIE